MAEAKQAVGTPMSRVDGRLKVTGGARYAAEFQVKDVACGALVLSTAGKVVLPEKAKALVDPKVGRPLQPFQDDQVHYHGQPIAVVVADTFERATHAGTLVRATYDEAKAVLDFADAAARRFTPHQMKESPDYQRGEPDKA